MAQKVTGIIKLQINAAKATASPPVGPALGQHGVNIAAFIKDFRKKLSRKLSSRLACRRYKLPLRVRGMHKEKSVRLVYDSPQRA